MVDTPSITTTGGFVHLHLHSEYSLLDGGNRIDRLVARVKELGMPAVAVTDHGNIHGAIQFALAAKAEGIKPILGVEAYVASGDRRDRTHTGVADGGYHLVLLAENNEGWQNLLYLCSEAYLTGFYYKPRIDRALLEIHNTGLIAINGHLGSEIGEHLLDFARSNDRKFWDAAVSSARWHAGVFGPSAAGQPRFYIEMQHHVPEQNQINPLLIRLARELGLPLVGDNDAHFLKAEDHDAHDTLICISMGKNKDEPDRLHYTPELYVKSPAQMREAFAAYGEAGTEALDNSVKIAERCHVELPLGRSFAPVVRVRMPAEADLPRANDARFGGDLSAWHRAYSACFELSAHEEGAPGSEGHSAASLKAGCDRALRLLAEAGMTWRYGLGVTAGRHGHVEGAPGTAEARTKATDATTFDLWARLNRELAILADKQISAYFLIVWDFVNWGRQRSIPAIARGSGVGTMTGYVLGLSNACPVRYGLLFERFTDPDRSEYPDIDIDLCQDGRASVIEYVRQKYTHVAQIITFGTMKARAAIRDVARVLGIPLSETDKVAKLVPEALGMTLDKALEEEPELKKLYQSDARITRLIDTAKVLEGQARHCGVHAAGVVIANRPLHEIVPLYRQPGSEENEIVTQWDGPTCEKMGLLKMDFLGLRTISVIERAKKLIRASLGEEEIWAAVGRGAEYQQWQSSRVAGWQSGESAPERSGHADQDVSGPAGLATRHGPRTTDVQANGANAARRALRADQPDAPGRNVDPDEHCRGDGKALDGRVHSGAANRNGVSARTHDGLRTGDDHGHDRCLTDGARCDGRRGSPARIAHRETGGEVDEGNARASALTAPSTLPLGHSATLPLSGPHPLDLDRLTFDDPKVFDLFQRGETTGVFQFESGGMRRLLVDMKPDRLEDLIAANALFRPGPMDLIPDYNARKHGQQPVPDVHPIVNRFTAETYGVMVYQEQVMQIVHELGGIPLRAAYSLIKAISKKKEKEINKTRPTFIEGAVRQGLTKAKAEELFEMILKFAGYGFNKSHSTGYAIVAYQTAYLKTYFPRQYMAAFLSYESKAQKASDWIPYLEDARKTRSIDPRTGEVLSHRIEVKPPDINLSQADFAVVYEEGEPRSAHTGHIRFGLTAIKGVGEKAIDAVLREREGRGRAAGADEAPGERGQARPFTSIFEFCERVPQGSVNKAAIEALVKCGALDSLHGRDARASVVASIEGAVSAGQRAAADRAAGQGGLFGFGPVATTSQAPAATPLARVPAWSESETLKQEKETLGFYVSSHPLEEWSAWTRAFAPSMVGEVAEMAADKRVVLAALVGVKRMLVVKQGRSKGQRMAALTIEDLSGSIEGVMFADCFARYGHLLEDEAPKFVLGRVDLSRGEPQIMVDSLVPIDTPPLERGRLRLSIREDRLNGHAEEALRRLGAALGEASPGRAKGAAARDATGGADSPRTAETIPMDVVVEAEGFAVLIEPKAEKRVALGVDLLREISDILGPGSAKVVGGVAIETEERPKWGSKRSTRRDDDDDV